MLRARNRLGVIAIVVFWAAMMGWLLYREVWLPQTAAVSGTAGSAIPQDLWLGVYLGEEERVGFIHFTTEPILRDSGAGTGLRLLASLRMDLFSLPTELNINGHAWRRDAGGLADFDFTLRSGDHRMRAEGTLADGVLDTQLHVGEDVTEFSLPVDDTLFFSGGMGMTALDLPALSPGDEVYIDSFDPTTMSVAKARVECTGKEQMTFKGETVIAHVLETTIGGITSKTWVTPDEQLVRAETAFGFVLKQITPEEALAPVNPGEQSDLIQTLAVTPRGEQPNPGASFMRVRIGGLREDQLPPQGAWQKSEQPGIYTLRTPSAPRDEATSAKLTNAADFLGGDPLVATDHEKIREAAKMAAGDATTDWETALALYQWVYDALEKVSVISLPSALDVLRTKQGDCNEHTVLFTAMARTLDIPTRIAIGLVYSETIEGFGYHAWPEVYVGEWIPMDPTLGQPLADATHIKLLNGSIDKWAQLAHYIGQIKVEVLEVE